MAKSERKERKERKARKDEKNKKEKKRKRHSSDSDDDTRGQKRLEKEADRLAKALQKGTTEAYADDKGELQLGGRFVWKKKIEKELQEGARTKDIYQREKMNTEAERRAEIEKVQRRREEREQDKQQREREQEQLARDRAAAEAIELEKKEDEFHLANAQARARHRLREGRGKPIDLLVRDLILGDEFEVGSDEPCTVFRRLPLADLEELREDLMEYQELDSEDAEHARWWSSLLAVCESELKEAARQDDGVRGERPGEVRRQREVGVHSAVDTEIQKLLADQSYGDLVKMEEDLKFQLESGTAPDPEFHSAILRRLDLHKAQAQLREMHKTLLARSLASGDRKVDVPKAMGWRQEEDSQDDDTSTQRFRALAAKSMGDINEAGDAPFGGEVQLAKKEEYWWHDKYRPRKPKYFNRVHTGYEWNKYNQTHYDHDNPPPKVVQGYKFNIFYPDLIDRKDAPEYSVEADPDADAFGSTCVLRFHAGPPYEDLTFRILNKEWEYSHKKGFKCVFDRDTLYLYFNFKRQRYRR